MAEMVNIVEPMPPSPRKMSSWTYDWAKAVANEEIATMISPAR